MDQAEILRTPANALVKNDGEKVHLETLRESDGQHVVEQEVLRVGESVANAIEALLVELEADQKLIVSHIAENAMMRLISRKTDKQHARPSSDDSAVDGALIGVVMPGNGTTDMLLLHHHRKPFRLLAPTVSVEEYLKIAGDEAVKAFELEEDKAVVDIVRKGAESAARRRLALTESDLRGLERSLG